jgi:heme oxygenase
MTSVGDEGDTSVGVIDALYVRTRTLHAEAEKSGIIADILRGLATREGYVLLLRNLYPAYRELERGIERHSDAAGMKILADYKLDRAGAIASDLMALNGEDWAETIALLPEGEAYARRVTQAAEGDGTRLIAHAYTRYMGDLSGGQIVQRLLERSYGLGPSELSHYAFAGFSDLVALKADYRGALDQAAAVANDRQAVIEEAAIAFTLNIGLSVAVKNALLAAPAATSVLE